MNRFIPMVLLVLGLSLAAASGGRLGDQHAQYRQDVWTAANGPDLEQVQARSALTELGVPGPQQRLSQWTSQSGATWLLGVLLIVAGAVLARRQQAAEVASGGAGGLVDFPAAIDAIEVVLADVAASLASVPMDDTAPAVRAVLDQLNVDVLFPVVQARGQFIARHGVAVFASYFSPFSGGERQLNRVWSALADGHVVEATAALADCRSSFAEAKVAWESANAQAA